MLNDLKTTVHSHLLALRSIELILHSEQFYDLYIESDIIERVRVQTLIDDYDRDGLAEWMRTHESLNLCGHGQKFNQ